jgi:hypothetical protein
MVIKQPGHYKMAEELFWPASSNKYKWISSGKTI